jgi:hypothetical protein
MFTWKLKWKTEGQCCYFAARLLSLTKFSLSVILRSNKVVTVTLMQNSAPEKKIFKKITAFLMANLEAE